ncbi:uncharacterized protein BDV17DRAFT_256112 [Aspergillus undulatus]|uniref:uncharacterized protein n=1 Tax=Aspergillus undulatus TaxID=1810928 RepID=UPI003CCD80F1
MDHGLRDSYKDRWEHSVAQEFNYRAMTQYWNGVEKIHHFNWEGTPIDGPSNTKPEISLFVMMCKPKAVLEGSDAKWKTVVIANAMRYVDPVHVRLNKRVDFPSLKDPQVFLRYGKDRTTRFYTRHGHPIVEDRGSTMFYLDQDFAVGNGFIDGHVVTSLDKRSRQLRKLEIKARPKPRRRSGVNSLGERWPLGVLNSTSGLLPMRSRRSLLLEA